jgi:uncharacterized protein
MISKLQAFVKPFYEKKDIMHDLSHVKRILTKALVLAKKHKANKDILTYGAYFHGFIYSDEKAIISFLLKQKLSKTIIDKILQVSWESQKDESPQTTEGLILHDAHLIEGGKTFLVVKALVTGTSRGQSLIQSVNYLAHETVGKYRCYLPEAQKLYLEKEYYAKCFLKDIKNNG